MADDLTATLEEPIRLYSFSIFEIMSVSNCVLLNNSFIWLESFWSSLIFKELEFSIKLVILSFKLDLFKKSKYKSVLIANPSGTLMPELINSPKFEALPPNFEVDEVFNLEWFTIRVLFYKVIIFDFIQLK